MENRACFKKRSCIKAKTFEHFNNYVHNFSFILLVSGLRFANFLFFGSVAVHSDAMRSRYEQELCLKTSARSCYWCSEA